jgi:hypothetical protein
MARNCCSAQPSGICILNKRFEGTGVRFATTLLGVASLVAPDLLVALEATAMD